VRRLGAIAIVVMALALAGCTSSTAPSLKTTISTTTATTLSNSKSEMKVVSRLPNGLSFASAPVLTSGGSEVVALLVPNHAPFFLRIARIDLSSGHVVVGRVVAKNTAGLFKGASGQVFLLTLSGGALGHFVLWRVPDDLALAPLARLPYPEKTTIISSWTDPTVAVAPVPSEDEAWIADANHLLLVDLVNGKLLASWPGPSDNEGNITSLAMASSSGPLYATLCGPLTHNPPGCGQIVEIDPRTGSIQAVRHYWGIVWYGRFETVATPAGVWLSLGSGGNGVWLELFTKVGLQPVSNGRTDHLWPSLGSFDLMADGSVVWAEPGGGLLCFSTGTSDKVRYAVASTGPLLAYGDPFGVEPESHRVLLAGDGDVITVPIPKACETAASAVPPKKQTGSEVQVLAQLPKNLFFDGYDSPPVLTDGGREAVALLGTGTGSNGNPPERLAKIELSTGKVTLGQKVAGIANLFTGNGGQVFLLNLCGSSVGHVELWRVGSNLKPVPFLRLPFIEATVTDGAPTDPAIAVATTPNSNQAWIADGKHIELVNLANGQLVASRPAPHGIYGNVTSLAMASKGGPLYMTFCLQRVGSQSLFACGVIAEVNPASWTVLVERHYDGPVDYGRYGLVATSTGAWYSGGDGGHGAWLDYFSKSGLHTTRVSGLVLGVLSMVLVREVVWGSFGGGGVLGCSTVSASGAPYTTVVDTNLILGAGYPLGLTSQGRLLVALISGAVVHLRAGALVAVSVGRACTSNG
jgi:hypothetical protein